MVVDESGISKTVGEKWHDEGKGESAIAWRKDRRISSAAVACGHPRPSESTTRVAGHKEIKKAPII
jgi:hypothetical protein